MKNRRQGIAVHPTMAGLIIDSFENFSSIRGIEEFCEIEIIVFDISKNFTRKGTGFYVTKGINGKCGVSCEAFNRSFSGFV